LSNAGFTCRDASKIVGISMSSVQRALARFEETGDYHDRPCSGRPKKLNDRNVRLLKRLIQNDGRYSSRETTIRLNNSLRSPVCRRTVINYLHDNGYQYNAKVKRPFLTKNDKKKT
jgi:transposase